MENPTYIGDGVYARYDGFALHVAVDNHRNEVVVLEPDTLESLNKFYKYAVDNFKPETNGSRSGET